jgi:hypothetical protein
MCGEDMKMSRSYGKVFVIRVGPRDVERVSCRTCHGDVESSVVVGRRGRTVLVSINVWVVERY